MIVNKILCCFLSLLIFAGCHPRSTILEPDICYLPQRRQCEALPSAFEPLTPSELEADWGKELKIGRSLAKELDLFRAITSLKRALILMPEEETDRRQEAEFDIVQSYFLGKKYQEAIETFEFGSIRNATGSFVAFRELLIILYESYLKLEQCEKAAAVLALIEKGDPETALDLKLFTSLSTGNLSCVRSLLGEHPNKEAILQTVSCYCSKAKSVRKAQWLNALAPGAGYYYVGQPKSALTSLVLNTSFLAATLYFFEKGNWGAGVFTASLEAGWYFGGINGAGLAAKEYNECVYRDVMKDFMIRGQIFPVLMLETSF